MDRRTGCQGRNVAERLTQPRQEILLGAPRWGEVFEFAQRVVQAGRRGDDRLAVVERGGVLSLVVADGAGGTGGGARAAERVVARFLGLPPTLDSALLVQLLERCDDELSIDGIETTAVVVATDGDVLVGASLGDSEAWLITSQTLVDLTEGQTRKPLLGSGSARPVAFRQRWQPQSTLLVATDGLFRFARFEDVLQVARFLGPLEAAVDRWLVMARLPSGNLADDVALVGVRVAR